MLHGVAGVRMPSAEGAPCRHVCQAGAQGHAKNEQEGPAAY